MPSYLEKYFWDIDFEKLNYKKYPYFVIGRILEYGDVKGLRWMFKRFSNEQIKQSLKNTKDLSLRTTNFWADFFNVNKKEVKCLTKLSQNGHKNLWVY